MKKRWLSLAVAATAAITVLAGCGSKAAETTAAATEAATTEAASSEAAESSAEETKAEAAAGWDVEVVEFNDYVQPNTSLEDGEIDANYFQTIRYLEEQNKERGLHLVEVAGIHLEPMGIYSKNYKSLEELPDGATIAVPNDGSNESRAIKLLADNGLITLKQRIFTT